MLQKGAGKVGRGEGGEVRAGMDERRGRDVRWREEIEREEGWKKR